MIDNSCEEASKQITLFFSMTMILTSWYFQYIFTLDVFLDQFLLSFVQLLIIYHLQAIN